MLNTNETLFLAKEKFKKFCEERQLKDFDKIVQVVHEDGSMFILHHASIWHSDEQESSGRPRWMGVSTEHNGDFFFHVGDLLDWWVR